MEIPESVIACREAFADSFMKPKFYRGESIQSEILESGLDLEDEGIYCRLSADGFMDCTDWSGPYATIDEAANALVEMYGDDS